LNGKRKERLDNILVEKGLAVDLRQARSLIMAGKVIVDDHQLSKPGLFVSNLSHVRVKNHDAVYAGRGGTKLERPLEVFNISVSNKIALDAGASTGGFTDCLLQKGAEQVFAVDVGYGQLAWKLQQDKRVVKLDRTNIRDLTPLDLQPLPDLAVIDVSFISLKKILPNVIPLLKPYGEILSLVKPQFEAEKEAVSKGGIVRDTKTYQKIIKDLVLFSQSLFLFVAGIVESPLPGQKGNREFFLFLRK
jgi:23S rRNA (cytidine1920-2'-O)/16S rRNA (cytidine1409-2'-O)-methyltransferase